MHQNGAAVLDELHRQVADLFPAAAGPLAKDIRLVGQAALVGVKALEAVGAEAGGEALEELQAGTHGDAEARGLLQGHGGHFELLGELEHGACTALFDIPRERFDGGHRNGHLGGLADDITKVFHAFLR